MEHPPILTSTICPIWTRIRESFSIAYRPSHNPELDKLVGNLLTLPTADPAQTTMASPFTGQPPWAYRLPAISARQSLETKADYTVPGQGWPLSAQQSTLRPYCLVQAGRDCTSSSCQAHTKLRPGHTKLMPSSCQAHAKLRRGHTSSCQAHAKLIPSSYLVTDQIPLLLVVILSQQPGLVRRQVHRTLRRDSELAS